MSGVLSVLLGAGGVTITLAPAYSPTSSVGSPTNALCQFELTSGGDIRETTVNNTVNDVGDWLTPKTMMSSFDAMMTSTSGTAPSGAALATWLNLGTTRTWTMSRNVLGITSGNCTLQIRDSATGTVLDSATIAFSAEQV